MNIFISYSSKSREIVSALAADLEALGDTVWFDRELTGMGGHEWWADILDNIRRCDLFLFALDPHSLDSYPCQLEYEYAHSLRKRILPVMLEKVNIALLPSALQELQIVDYQQRSKAQLAALSKTLNNLPPAQPLPDPLPPAPPTPLSPLARIRDTIDKPNLTSSEQIELIFELNTLKEKPDTAGSARLLLERLYRRDDLTRKVGDEIKELLDKQTPSAGSPDKRRTFFTPGLLALGVIVLLLLGGLTVFRGFFGGNALTPTSVSIQKSQVAPTTTTTPTSASTIAPTITAITPTVVATTAAPKSVLGSMRTDSKGSIQVWVPAGCFKMGSDTTKDNSAKPDEQPNHDVCITQGFWLDEYEVSNADYQKFIDNGGYTTRKYWSDAGWAWQQSQSILHPKDRGSNFDGHDQPRVGVSWYEADAYARWRGGHLPTEAQWEWAARGSDNRLYPWGSTWDANKANYHTCASCVTQPVMNYSNGVSWCGAYNMAGNVWEWVDDFYDANYYDQAVKQKVKDDLPGPTNGTVRGMRGGSWFNDLSYLRTATRRGEDPVTADGAIGFRIAS